MGSEVGEDVRNETACSEVRILSPWKSDTRQRPFQKIDGKTGIWDGKTNGLMATLA